MVAALRRARYGSLLALQLRLLGASGRPPTARAAVLLGARSGVSRTARPARAGPLGREPAADGRLV
jgi:hypothetical protein